jgi:hypothetical protein
MMCGVFFLQVSRLVLFVPMAKSRVLRFDRVMKVELPRVLWGVVGFSYLFVMCHGMEVLNVGFNGM